MTLDTGHQLQQGRYVIQELLGRGGMGTVYLATDRNLPGRLVAIKENVDTGPTTQNQFQYEAILLARLTHPNLPRVTDHFIEPSGYQYLVMDYVEGDDLRALLRAHQGPLPEELVRDWLDQVLSALSYMHNWIDPTTRKQTPIIHRDIKPGNIKRTPNGRIVLVDFGVAKVDETTEGTVVGARAITPGYSPLEQYSGSTDARSDIYALGATLYILLTGERPPEATAIAAGAPLPAPRQRNRLISRGLERVITRAMALHAADRFQSIEALRTALPPRRNTEDAARAVEGMTPIAPHLTLTWPPARPPRRAYWSGIGALTLLTLVVIGLIAMPDGWLARWRPVVTPPSTAPTTATVAAVSTATPPSLTLAPLTLAGASGTKTVVAAPVAAVLPTAVVTRTVSAALTTAAPVTATQPETITAAVLMTITATRSPTAAPATPTVTPSPSATAPAVATVTSTPPPTATATPPPPTATATALPPTATATALPTSTPSVTPVPVAGDRRTNPVDGAVYRFVPAGPFTMGSTMEANELPVHTITLAAFWIMETEITNALYAQCVTAGVCTPPANDFWQDVSLVDHPVTHVDWAQAAAYATWAQGRLPTEAEWEKAARGTDERLFPWPGESTDETRLNFLRTGTMPVGSFAAGASPFGVLDMAGNVEEWVADWYSPDYYAASPPANPPGPATGLLRVVRGGSFNSNRGSVRTTARGRAQPDAHFPSIGFRVVLPERAPGTD